MYYAILITQLLFVPAVSPLLIGCIRKIKAKMQNREGASVFQPYRDLRKLFKKDEILSKDASWISSFAPFIVFAVTLVVGAVIPVVMSGSAWGGAGDFIVIIYLMALGTFFLALNGLDAGNAFGGLGSSREMTLAALTEGGLFFSLLPLAVIAGSTNLEHMLLHVETISAAGFVALFAAFCAFFIALLAENARYPFDNPSTHLELTMVHEAMIIETSGRSLGLMEWAAGNKLAIFLVLGANLFFPWGLGVPADLTMLLGALFVLLFKVFALAAVVGVVESSMPKLRYFRLPPLLFASFVLGVIALVISVF